MYCVDDIRQEYDRLDIETGVDTSKIELIISNRSVAQYGCCVHVHDKVDKVYRPSKIRISAHVLHEEDEFWDVIRHEYAHAVAIIRDPKKLHRHDNFWKLICLEVGCKPSARAEETEAASSLRKERAKYIVTCAGCGEKIYYLRLNRIIKALQAGRTVSCLKCRGKKWTLEYCSGDAHRAEPLTQEPQWEAWSLEANGSFSKVE